MKRMNKLLCLALAVVMVLGLLTTGCAKTTSNTVHHKIGVALYTDSGKSVDAIKAYLAGISEAVDCEFVYATLSTYDEATNLTAIQNLISAGCEGIILTADMGTVSILEECEAADVYLAGFLCDFNQSFYTAHDDVFGSPNFLGSVCDGWRDASPYGEMVAADVIEKGYKNVGILVFPAFAYPNQMEVAKTFMAKIDEYNATAAEPITYYQPEELMFQPLADTYLAEHPDMDCLFSVAAGAGMVYPVLVANNRTDVKLYTTGFEGTDDVTNFGSSGNGCYSGALFSAPEAIVYPLCLLIDALNGVSYADMPEEPQVVDCMPLVVISEEAMQAVVDYSMYFNADYARAVIPGEQVKNLCASYNPKATYADLVAVLATLGVDHLGK